MPGIIRHISDYGSQQLDLHRRAFTRAVNQMMGKAKPATACTIMNMRQYWSGRSMRFGFDTAMGIYFATEGNDKHWFADRYRGFGLYRYGLHARSRYLASTYFIDQVTLRPGDVVIECGANYGDLYPYLSNFISPRNYHSFEPSKAEFDCLALNAPGANNNSVALFSESGTMDFYISSSGADSSLVEPANGYESKTRIDTISLERYMADKGLDSVRLLKLEAEGLEPEILIGCGEALEKIEYIAVDGGEERGLKSEETLSTVANYLIHRGFDLLSIDIKARMGRALFRRADGSRQSQPPSA